MALITKLFVVFILVGFSLSLPLDLSEPNELAGKSLREWVKSKKKGNPEEQGSYLEGDIVISVEARNGISSAAEKWENGKIPYEIIGNFNQAQKNVISDAIDHLKAHTCLKFVPRASEKNYIQIDNKISGCWSVIGMVGGPQTVNLQSPGCVTVLGTAVHELLHAVGFYHEQSRYDRNKFVKVNYENIPRDKRNNFDKMSRDEQDTFGVAYDIGSILHYSPYAFAIDDSKMTIESKVDKSLNDSMGQRKALSSADIIKINAMYCGGSK